MRLFCCRFFVRSLILNSTSIFFFGNGFVSAGIFSSPLGTVENNEDSSFDWNKFEKPIEDDSVPANSWLAASVRNVIKASTKYGITKKPLTFFTALDETCQVNQTEKSLTVATMTGGILGHDLFELHEYSFAWRADSCNSTYTLESRVIYWNTKYRSFEEALDRSDGIVLVIFPISTNDDLPNPRFYQFSNFLQTKLKAPGDRATIRCKFTYTWFVNFPFGSIYHTYKMPYFDQISGKKTLAIVILLPLDPRINFISKEQFKGAFARIDDTSGQMTEDNGNWSPVETHKGIVVINLPA